MLADDIVSLVQNTGWVARQAVIDAFREFDAERIGYEMRELVARKRLTTRNGRYSMEYAIPGTPSDLAKPRENQLAPVKAPTKVEALRTLAASGRLPDLPTREPSASREDKPQPGVRRAVLKDRVRIKGRLYQSPMLAAYHNRDVIVCEDTADQSRVRVLDKKRDLICDAFLIIDSPSSQQAPTRATADQPTVSTEAAPTSSPDTNGGNCSNTGSPSPGEAPDGAAAQASSGPEHPASSHIEHVPDPEAVSEFNYPEGARVPTSIQLPPGLSELTVGIDVTLPDSIQEHATTIAIEAEPLPPPLEPRFALWSDGRLQMLVEGEEIILSRLATKTLFQYLDVINYDAVTEPRP